MSAFLPDSISARAMLVFIVGLTLSHLVSMAILAGDRHDSMVVAAERLAADRIGALARLLDRTPAGERAELVASFSSPMVSVALSPAPIVDGPHDDAALDTVLQGIEPFFGQIAHGSVHVQHEARSAGAAGGFWQRLVQGFPEDRLLKVAIRLSDGDWANFQLTMALSASLWSSHAIVSTLVMMAGIILLTRWAASWIAAPLATFAGAAERLGRDVEAPSLSEAGPREVRQAVAAFNEMQSRIRRFVGDRTRMLAAISHDLRSPITRLRLRTEMLPEGPARERSLADLDEMEAMVASALAFARDEASDELSQPVDLASTLEAVCDDAADIGLPAEFSWPGRLVCHCRPLAIKRAFANLVENAARYGKRAMVSAELAGRDVIIVIEDEGPGLDEEEMEKVFNPFYRVEGSRNRATGGIGLGLTVARSVIRAHGGDIRLQNRKGGGLRVIVTVPRGEGI